jgi:chromosome segregation ATPase
VALGEHLTALGAEREAAERETQEMRAALAELAGRLSPLEAGFEALRGQVSEARLHRSELALRLESISARAQELHDLDLAPRAAELAASIEPEADPAAEARRVRESLLRLGRPAPRRSRSPSPETKAAPRGPG